MQASNTKKLILTIVVFLIINFGGLAIGGLFTGNGATSDWYLNMNRAPWTPPGWFFGVAWTTIMICFSVYMALLWYRVENRNFLLGIFGLQFLLNVGWNPVFFYFRNVLLGLFVIVLLTFLIGFFTNRYWKTLKLKSALVLPYLIWLVIATSLNAYVYLMN
ncbi:MAG: TspO/MBR family protein [Bacteroidota bacterium]